MPGFVVNNVGAGAPSTIKPRYSYTWEIESLFDTAANRNTSPLLYIQSASLPSWQYTKESIKGSSLTYKYADGVTFDDIKLVWYDMLGLHEQVDLWSRSIWHPISGLQPPSTYKKRSIITSYLFNWEEPSRWMLINSWPSAISIGDLSYTSSVAKLVNITVSYDWAEIIQRLERDVE